MTKTWFLALACATSVASPAQARTSGPAGGGAAAVRRRAPAPALLQAVWTAGRRAASSAVVPSWGLRPRPAQKGGSRSF